MIHFLAFIKCLEIGRWIPRGSVISFACVRASYILLTPPFLSPPPPLAHHQDMHISHLFLLGSAILGNVLAVSPLVKLDYSTYQGETLPNGVSQWLGMRYAAPPVGDLRFSAPEDPLHYNGTQSATSHGKLCLATQAGPPSNTTDEDCLFLEVFAPSNATADSALPVFFFIQAWAPPS